MRLGELLLADGLITPDDLEAALAQHRQSGARLGSVLYLSGKVTADAIARALARQRGVPAALIRHLDGRDPTLTTSIPGDLARRYLALPVALSRGRAATEPGGNAVPPPPSLVVCMRDPANLEAVAALSKAAGLTVVAAVACEAVLATHVARAYPATDEDGDGVDVVFDEVSGTYSLPLGEIDPTGLMLVDLDDKRVARDHTQTAPMPTVQRNTPPAGYAAIAPDTERPRPSNPSLAPPAAAKAAIAASAASPRRTQPVPVIDPVLDCDAAIAALAAATTRDAVGDAAIAFLRGGYGAGAVLLVRDGLALGHRGFGGSVTPGTVESIVVPLHLPSMLRTAHDGGRPFVGAPPSDGGTVQDRFLRLFGGPRDVVVVPVVLRDRPVCLVFAAQPQRAGDDVLSDLLAVVAAMEEAYLRIIRDAKKSVPGADAPPVEPG